MGTISVNEDFYRNGYNPYRKLKPVEQNNLRNKGYLEIFENFFMEIWNLGNLPDDFDIKEYFLLKLYEGRVGWYKDSQGVYIGKVEETGGKLDRYGHLDKVSITFKNGEFYEGKRDKDIIIGYLNKNKTREPNFHRFADMLSQTDLSMKMNIEKTRLNPIPIFSDQKIKDTIQASIEAIRNGEQKFYLYEPTLENLVDTKDRFDMLNLTDVKDIDKIKYLCEFHDDLISRLCVLYGINMIRDTKMAQQTTDEIKGYANLAMVNILNMLECFNDEIDKVNSTFGTNITVELSKPWEWITSENIETVPEEDNDVVTEEKEDNEVKDDE